MPLILPGNVGSATAATGFNVSNSLRFDDGSTDYLSISGSTPGNRKKFTYSFWFKRSHLGTDQALLSYESDSNNRGQIQINTSDQFRYFERSGGSTTTDLVTNRLFRDVSAWYHIIIAVDTTQGTNTNRVKIYVNGVQETSFSTSTYPSQNYDTNANGTYDKNIGRRNVNGDYKLDGYLAEVVFVDGTQQANTDLGEFDEDSGIWKPIDVSGLTFGTNGFYQEYKQSGTSQNSSGLGADTSGNDNHFAVTNLTAIDQSTDTCTNNAVTFMSNHPSAANFTLSEGNLQINKSGTGQVGLYGSSIMLSKGKWYWEVKYTAVSGSDRTRTGVAAYESITGTSTIQNDYSGFEFSSNADGRFSIVEAGSTTEIDDFADFEVDDIVSYALDMDNTKLYVGINGVFFNYDTANTGGDPTSGNGFVTNSAVALAAPVTIYAGNSRPATGTAMELQFNFGATNTFAISSGNQDGNGYGNFEYAVPSGYYAINTKNLSEYG